MKIQKTVYHILNTECIRELSSKRCLKILDDEKEECLRTIHNDIETQSKNVLHHINSGLSQT